MKVPHAEKDDKMEEEHVEEFFALRSSPIGNEVTLEHERDAEVRQQTNKPFIISNVRVENPSRSGSLHSRIVRFVTESHLYLFVKYSIYHKHLQQSSTFITIMMKHIGM